jgi:starch synthase
MIRTLFVTPEFEDLIRVGGLASVSAALPRALRHSTDVRLVLPGYRHVLSQLNSFETIGGCRLRRLASRQLEPGPARDAC